MKKSAKKKVNDFLERWKDVDILKLNFRCLQYEEEVVTKIWETEIPCIGGCKECAGIKKYGNSLTCPGV